MSNLPSQRIPLSQKGEKWREECVKYFEEMSFSELYNYRSTNYRKSINYDLFNGRFNIQDFEYVCNPLGIKGGEFPATLQHYDIISPALMLLMGEEIKRPDNFRVISENADAVSKRETHTYNAILENLNKQLQFELGQTDKEPEPLEHVQEYLKYSYQDVREIIANKSLMYLKRFLNTKMITNKGWKDALIAGEEIYWTGIVNGDPSLRKCNTLDVTAILDNDSDFIDDAQAVVEVRRLTLGTILDEYGEVLTASQIKELEELVNGKGQNSFNGGNGIAPDRLFLQAATSEDPTSKLHNNVLGRPKEVFSGGNIRVVHVEWKSLRKLGTRRFIDENDLPQEETVTEQYKEQPGDYIEWFWVPEAWEGDKIGHDMYVNIRPKPNQRKRLDNPYYCKLGYTGAIYNATNSASVSLVDRMKPYQYLYNVLMYRLELAFASDMGKVFLMDIAQIPTSEGWNVEQWMYYLKAMKIAFINSHEVGKSGPLQGQKPTFNQFQSIDLSLGNYIQQHINSLEFIKNQVAFLSGVSPQRLGAINNQELVGNVERAVTQSSHITEPWFEVHNQVKRNVYTSLIECAKLAWSNGKKIQYVLDDMSVDFFSIDGPEFENSDFSVFVSQSSKDEQILETLKQMSQAALQADKVQLSEVVKMMKSESTQEIARMLEDAENKRNQQAQENMKAEQQAQQSAIAAQQEMAAKQLELDKYAIDENNRVKIEVAEINSFSKQLDQDIDNNGVPDQLEIDKIRQKDREINLKDKESLMKDKLERDKMKHTSLENDKQREIDLQLERLKLRNKPKPTKK